MTQTPGNPPQLMPLRVIWFALIMGQVMFAIVVLTVLAHPNSKPLDPVLLYVDIALLAACIPVAFIVRAIIYRGGRNPDGTIAVGAYATGNIIFWAMCEGSAFFSLVCTMLGGGRPGTPLLLAGIALAVQIANFPTGRPLREG
jgi:hypothetical protein